LSALQSFANIFSVPDLRKRVLFTFLVLAVYRLGAHIPTPGVDPQAISAFFKASAGSIFGFLDIFSGGALRRLWWRIRDGFAAIDRRLPIDGRYVLVLLAIAVIAVGVVTSGFGLVGGSGGGGNGKHGSNARPKATVAVINGTSVPGLAATVEQKVVTKSGYKTGPVGNATTSVPQTVVEYASGMRPDAQKFAAAVKKELGDTPVQPMTPDTRAAAGKVDLALVLGLDDAGFGGGG